MRAFSGWFAFVLLLGTVLGFAAGRFDHAAEAQSVDNKTTRWLGATVTYSQSQDAFVLFDSQTNRLMAYGIDGTKKLHLIAVREISYDLKLTSYGEQKPTVLDIKKAWEEEEKKEREREK
ncbi:MAG: hypothetical protein HYY16_08625 [Planctomycetes bacterium]|nr:hypothetical protein [Planctomycetota bacterium]